jgi:PAS domain S-box-containing protein
MTSKEERPAQVQRDPSKESLWALSFADSAPVLIWICDQEGRFSFFNKTWLDFTGRSMEQELKDAWSAGVHPEDLKVLLQIHKAACESRQSYGLEFRLKHRDGEYHWIWNTASPHVTAQGEFLGYIGTGVDVTHRKRIEHAAHESERRISGQNKALVKLAGFRTTDAADLTSIFKEITETAARTLNVERASIWIFAQDGATVRCEDLYERKSDRHSAEMELRVVDYPSYFKGLGSERTLAAHDAHTDERTREFSKGYLIPLGISSMLDASIRLGGRLVGMICHEQVGPARRWTMDEQNFAGSMADMVSLVLESYERKRAEEALKKSEERFRLVARATNDAVWDWDLASNTMWWSEAVFPLFGYRLAEIGSHFDWRRERIHPEDQEAILTSMNTVIEGGGELWSGEYRFQKVDGSYADIYDRGYVIRDAQGKPIRMIGAMADVTERKKLEARILQSEKLSAMGHLAAGVAHEVNNPLGVILGFAQALSRRVIPGDALEHPIRSIEREAIRCKNLVQDLLTFSRSSQADREPIDLNMTVEGALSLIQARAKMSKAEVRTEFSENLPRILGNRNQIQQVVVNLANNAFDAMSDGGVLTVRTELKEGTPHSWVHLLVSDTGAGIPQEIIHKIFEPFFTTKPVGQGTGLGLSLVYEIVKKNSGQVEVKSRPGATEFCIKFPARTGREAEQNPA